MAGTISSPGTEEDHPDGSRREDRSTGKDRRNAHERIGAREIRTPEADDARSGSSPTACTYHAWPTTLKEAKPKAGTIAGIIDA